MEKDKYIKQILLNSAEGALENFTDVVLKRINGLSAIRLYDEPLVHPKWQRRFLFTFGFIVIAILVLCLLIAVSHTDIVNWIKSRELPEIGYNKILIFILCFWIVFAVNTLIEKKFLPTRKAFNANGK
jgi:hypothetical protein